MAVQVDQLWSQAQCHIAAREAAPARAALEALLAADPAHTLARLALCNLAWRQNRVREATEHALHAARDAPDYPELICETIGMLLRVGETVVARECLQRPVLDRVTVDTVLLRLADYWHALGEYERALALMNHARAMGFDGDGIFYRRGRELVCLDRIEEAEPDLELALLLGPGQGDIALDLAKLRTQTRERNHLARLINGLKSATHGSSEHAALEFALYKELEDVGRYDEAWQALTRANSIMAQRKRCDAERMRRWFDLSIALCTREALPPTHAKCEGPQPIFIVGLPHSGTNLLARLLGEHPQVANAGELPDFEQQLCWAADHRVVQDERFLERVPALDFEEIGRRYLARTQWRAQGKPYYLDSRPDNWMYAGLIHAALPHARILHVTREPMDACFAQYRSFSGDTHEYAYDLNALAVHYPQYRRMMTHWQMLLQQRILDTSYVDLLSKSRTTMQRVLKFCELPGKDLHAVPSQALISIRATRSRDQGAWRAYAARLSRLHQALSMFEAVATMPSAGA